MTDTIKPAVRIQNPQHIFDRGEGWQKLGVSSGNRSIIYRHLKSGEGALRILLLGGVHGNETEGIQFMHEFCKEYVDGNKSSPFPEELFVIPVMNPDGLFNYERKNANGVDLNRNMATNDWDANFSQEKYFPGDAPNSEPETQHLAEVIDSYKPEYIISFHSWKPMINYNGPAVRYAEKIAEKLTMPITSDIGYPTPGSLGTYAGKERGIPTITLEFERGMPLKDVYPLAKEGILNSFGRY